MPDDAELSLLGDQALAKKFVKLPVLLRIRVAREGLTAAALIVKRRIKENLTGRLLNVRSGRLRSSIAHRIEEADGEITAKIGTNVKYARIHEYGGTIRPKRAKHLTIPLGPALTPSGVARYTARELISNPGIGGFTRTFFRGRAIFGVRGAGRPVAVFALVDMVRIREKRYMRISLAESRKAILQGFGARVQHALEQA